MSDVAHLDEHRPHYVLPEADGDMLVVPEVTVVNFVNGMPLAEFDAEGMERILRAIAREWLLGAEATT